MWSNPTIVLVERLTDPSKHTNLLCFVPVTLALMQSSEGKETSKNILMNFEKSSAFMVDWLTIIWCIVPGYFRHFLEIPAQARCIPRGLML